MAGVAMAQSLSRAEVTVCKNIKHCADIIDQHSPEEFDYDVLHQEFMRLGPQAVGLLFRMMNSKDEVAISRAQSVLSAKNITFSPQDQSLIARLWPRGNLTAHAKIMENNLSPVVLSRAIETLSDDNPEVRNLARGLIDSASRARALPKLSDLDITRLSKAAIHQPSPGMVKLLGAISSNKTQPVFTRILRSGDAPSVIASYETLFAKDPKTAFQTLLRTLYDLKDNEGQSALALAALLQHRHKSRSDGFYLNFAKDIANDPKMSPMGRVVGFDAVMGYDYASPQNRVLLSNTPLMVENLKTALKAYPDVPINYARNFYHSAKDNAQPWANVIWNKLKTDPYKNPDTAVTFFRFVGELSSPAAQSIVSQALNDQRDYGMINLGLKTALLQKDKSRLREFETFLTHPISDVRATSAAAITALKNNQRSLSPERLADNTSQLNTNSKFCKAIPINFKAGVNQLPFFDLKDAAIKTKAPLRHFVNSIAPTSTGWLVGYGAGDAGGDLQFYDNKTGQGASIMYPAGKEFPIAHNNVLAILPIIPQPLGQYASDFWALITHDGPTNNAAVYRISKNGNGFTLDRHVQLPSNKVQLSQQANADLFISFFEGLNKKEVHPPLILSKEGSLRRACETSTNTPLKVLP